MSIHRSIFLSIYLSVYLTICMSIYLSTYFICLSIYRPIHLSIYPSIFLSIYLSICLSVCVFIDLSVYLAMYLSIYISLCTHCYERTHKYMNKHIRACLHIHIYILMYIHFCRWIHRTATPCGSIVKLQHLRRCAVFIPEPFTNMMRRMCSTLVTFCEVCIGVCVHAHLARLTGRFVECHRVRDFTRLTRSCAELKPDCAMQVYMWLCFLFMNVT